MACFHPLRAFLYTHPDGTRAVRVVSRDASPPSSDLDWSEIWLPCGKCCYCRLRKSQEWTLRCVHEASQHPVSCFITLTFNKEHVSRLPSGHLTLPGYDVFQAFLKRLRNKLPPFRFYMCGEYGSTTKRPHYHAILFGVDLPDRRHHHIEDGHFIDISKILQDCWPYGYSSVGDAPPGAIAYVCRYVNKKRDRDKLPPGVVPEYSRMSLKPGIGATWFDRYRNDVYKADVVLDEVYRDAVRFLGRDLRPPRYYDKLMTRGSFADYMIYECVHDKRVRDAKASPPDFEELARREQFTLYAASQSLKAKLIARKSPLV